MSRVYKPTGRYSSTYRDFKYGIEVILGYTHFAPLRDKKEWRGIIHILTPRYFIRLYKMHAKRLLNKGGERVSE